MYWYDLKRFDRDMLTDARLQTHYALQWLGRAARAYGRNTKGGAVNLGWVDGLQALAIETLPGDIALALRVEDLTLLVLAGGTLDGALALDGIDDAAVGEWVFEQMSAYGFDGEALMEPLGYDKPDHPIGEGAAYDTISGGLAFSELVRWLSNGQAALLDLCGGLEDLGPRPTPIRCSPQSFALSTFIRLDKGAGGNGANGGKGRRIQVGLSPGDAASGEPYFFVSPRPGLEPADLPEFIDIGKWQVNGVVDAVAPASDFVGEDLQAKYVREFLDRAVTIGRERLRK